MSTFHLTISTPDGMMYDGEVKSIRLRMFDGELGILPNHENYVSSVGAGECVITEVDGNIRRAACIGGLLSMIDNHAKVLPTTFEWAENIDLQRAVNARDRAQERLATVKQDDKDFMIASAKLKRALVRIQVKS